MIFKKEQYRVFETKNWVFLEGGPETAVLEKQEKKTDPMAKKNLGESLGEMEIKYGEAAYREIIEEQAKKYTEKLNTRESEVIDASIKRYMLRYEEIRQEFIRESQSIDSAYEAAVSEIEVKIEEELLYLKESLKKAGKANEKQKEAMPDLREKREINRYFENYLKTLNEHYLKGNEYEESWQYRSETWKFQQRMELWVQGKINAIHQKQGAKSEYETLKAEINQRYERIAGIDKNPSNISHEDLIALENRMNLTSENTVKFFEEAEPGHPNYEAWILRMEDFALMHPETWKKEVDDIARNIVDQVENDRMEEAFITFVSTTIEPVKNFRKAKKAFLKHMETLAPHGVKATIDFMNLVTSELLKDTLNPEKEAVAEVSQSVSKTFGKEVGRQMDYLMSGAVVPEKETDKMLVRFMQGDEGERKSILSNRQSSQVLARAIAEATEGYPKIYQSKYGSLSKEVTHSKKLSKPTTHDMAARLQALIILGNQSKNIVKNYSEKALNEINNIQINPDHVEASLKFNVTGEKNVRVRSRLDRGGFNGRDLGLKALKIFGALTVVTNFFEAFSATSGQGNFFTRLALTIPNAITNPAFMLGAGVTTLAYKSEQDPRFLKWPWLSPREKADILTADRLRSIGSKVGEKKRDQFLANPTEWKVMKRMNKEDAEKLISAAQKAQKKGKMVGISPDLLVQEGILDKAKDAELYYHLTQGSNRTRYLFYNKFLHAEAFNVHDIKEHCTGSSFIS